MQRARPARPPLAGSISADPAAVIVIDDAPASNPHHSQRLDIRVGREKAAMQEPFTKPDGSERAMFLEYDIDGFSNQELNGVYSPDANRCVGGRKTYWSRRGDFFMYFHARECKWYISPRWESPGPGKASTDLYIAACIGGSRGLAIQVSQNSWREFFNNKWYLRELDIDYLMCVPEDTLAISAPSGSASSMCNLSRSKSAADTLQKNLNSLVEHTSDLSSASHALTLQHMSPEIQSSPVVRRPRQSLGPPNADPSRDYRRVWIGWFAKTVTTSAILEFLGVQSQQVEHIEHKCGMWSEAIVHFKEQQEADNAVKQYNGKFILGRRVQVGHYQDPALEAEGGEDGSPQQGIEILPDGTTDGNMVAAFEDGEKSLDREATDGLHGEPLAPMPDPNAGEDFWGESSPIANATGLAASAPVRPPHTLQASQQDADEAKKKQQKLPNGSRKRKKNGTETTVKKSKKKEKVPKDAKKSKK